MSAEIGTFCLCLALALSVAQALTGLAGMKSVWSGWGRYAEGAALGTALLTLIAFVILIHAFVTSDFSVANVAQHSHTAKPLLYKISGAWASHEGSMLLWDMLLCLYGALVVIFGAHLPDRLKHRVIGVQGALTALFLGFTLFTSNPLMRLDPAPLEGQSLNPLLQDPALAFHPPMLYLGYVGCSIVFSFALAALIDGRIDRAWARWVRPWALIAWGFLTLGITLGAFWAYYELGWGGWWFWDPVENASFMPWLAATALLHSAIVMEKRDALKAWTVFLGLLAFSFSMLGAFLVRSGVLTSVHAFAVDPQRGIVLLAILMGVSGLSFGLYGWRVSALPQGGLFATISRESLLMANNILLAASLGTVCLGTLYPLIIETVSKDTVSVGAPWFMLTFGPVMAAAVLLVPVAIALRWKRDLLVPVLKRLGLVAGLAVVLSGLVLAIMGGKDRLAQPSWLLGLGLGLWLLLGSLWTLYERVKGGGLLKRLRGLPLSVWGMSLAHIGLGLFIMGAAVELRFKQASVDAIPEGGQIAVSGLTARLNAVIVVDGPNYQAVRGRFTLKDSHGHVRCEAAPERRAYPASHQTTSEVWLCYSGLDDYYVVLGEARPAADGTVLWQVRLLFNPWVRLIFLGPLIMALGGVLSLSDRHMRASLNVRTLKASDIAEKVIAGGTLK